MHSAELNVPQNHVYLFKPQAANMKYLGTLLEIRS